MLKVVESPRERHSLTRGAAKASGSEKQERVPVFLQGWTVSLHCPYGGHSALWPHQRQ